MSSDRAELDSATTMIDELVVRISTIANQREAAGDAVTATDLYDVERSLVAASRKLTSVVRNLDD